LIWIGHHSGLEAATLAAFPKILPKTTPGAKTEHLKRHKWIADYVEVTLYGLYQEGKYMETAFLDLWRAMAKLLLKAIGSGFAVGGRNIE
jgi:hypothetical protein